jgi:hypothetical protein
MQVAVAVHIVLAVMNRRKSTEGDPFLYLFRVPHFLAIFMHAVNCFKYIQLGTFLSHQG